MRFICLFLLYFLLSPMGTAFAKMDLKAADEGALEEDVFAVVRIHNPQELLPRVAALVDKFQPGMGGLVNSMMVGQQVFNNPEWKGMDMAGEYTAVIFNPVKYSQNPVALIAPLVKGDEFLEVLSSNLSRQPDIGELQIFKDSDQEDIFIGITGEYGVIAQSPQLATQAKILVETENSILTELPVVKGQIAASIGLKRILVALQPMIDMFKEQALNVLEMEMEGSEEENKDQPSMSEIAEIEMNTLLETLREIDQLQLGVGLEEQGVRISKAMFALPNTAVGKFMKDQVPKKPALLGIMPADSSIMISTSLNITKEFKQAYLNMMNATFLGNIKDEAAIERISQWMENAFEVFKTEFVVGMLSPASETLVTEVMEISDSAKAKALFGEYPEMLDMMMTQMTEDIPQDVVFDLTLSESERVQGGEIMRFDSNLSVDSLGSEEEKALFTRFFGQKFNMPIGLTEKYAVMSLGKSSEKNVASIMSNVSQNKKIPAAPYFAEFGLPEESNMFMYLSVPRLLQWMQNMSLPGVFSLPQDPETGESMIDIQVGPGIGMTGSFIDSHFEGELFVPMEEVMILKNLITKIQRLTAAASAE